MHTEDPTGLVKANSDRPSVTSTYALALRLL